MRQSVGEGPRAKPPQRPAGDLGSPGGARLALPPPPVCRSGRGSARRSGRTLGRRWAGEAPSYPVPWRSLLDPSQPVAELFSRPFILCAQGI